MTGRPVKDENDAKGYAHGENDYVILTDDDLCNVALDTVKTIDIQKFAPAESIEWVYLEKPYYLTPDDAVGYEAFAVTDKVVSISKLIIGPREKVIVLEPRDDGIVCGRFASATRFGPEETYLEDIDDDDDDPDLIPLAQKLIKQKTARWSPNMVSDSIQESLLKLIAEKKKALKPKKAAKGKKSEAAGPKSNVINIMDALRKSVADELKSRKSG